MLCKPPLSLYIHIPWCLRKCPYCDFNSHARLSGLPEADYVTALLSDLDHERHRVGDRCIETVFLGGGTPSLFGATAIGCLLDGIAARVPLAAGAEITLEANPGTFEAKKFRDFRAAGINRLSIGIQSFDDGMLQALGRVHDGREASRAVEIARAAGFDNLNLDLMFGLPGQSAAAALADLRTATTLNPEHLSWYQLTLEPGTAFFKQPPMLPDDELTWTMQAQGQALLAEAGYRQYEVSAYAHPGHECRHNVNYWTFGDYLGIGAGAHGKSTEPESDRLLRTAKARNPEVYLGLRAGSEPLTQVDAIDRGTRGIEFLMNQLRLRRGFAETLFPQRTGLRLDDLEPALSDCVAEGLLERNAGVIRCSDHGWQFLNDLLGRFVH